jgi:hypothetical protein
MARMIRNISGLLTGKVGTAWVLPGDEYFYRTVVFLMGGVR